MSWLNPHKQFGHLMCKITPDGSICRNYLMAEHPECFKDESGYFFIEMPKNLWRRMTTAHGCPQTCTMAHDDLENAIIYKTLFFIAASIGMVYAVLKVIQQRRTMEE